jgi:hypothetical protein
MVSQLTLLKRPYFLSSFSLFLWIHENHVSHANLIYALFHPLQLNIYNGWAELNSPWSIVYYYMHWWVLNI